MELTPYQWLGVGMLVWIAVSVVLAAICGFLSPSTKERDRRHEDELKTLENVVAFKARRGEVWRKK